MSGLLLSFLSYYVVSIIIEGFAWGLAGYVFFRLFKGKDNHWIIGAFITLIVFLAWEVYFSGLLLLKLNITISNPEIVAFLDRVGVSVKSMFETDITDIVIATVQILIGFKVAQFLFKKVTVTRSS